MKKYLLLFSALFLLITASHAQKKYPSLMWEITGNGLSKPSYLYGTMHVSDKLAFHLGDSFFIALNSVDVVALEINPETWVDDMLAYDPYAFWGDNMFYGMGKTDDKEKQWKSSLSDALRRDPSLINYYLYRSQGYTGNFEEDTYLDLYIFQTGKKLKKQVAGLEKMGELNLLLEEAERAREDEYKYKEQKYNYHYDEDYMSFEELLEDAYRRGDLDVIDSLNQADGTPGYLEYMLYRRNANMANRMDSIMRQKGLGLFAGMGASHLPGEKGVIEMLREKGYTLRPVVRGERETKKKKKIDEIIIPQKFVAQKSFDNYFEVDLPGKMYELAGFGPSRSYFHPDMANGAYYTVTRIKTFSRELEYKPDYVKHAIDSMLYENIPGEIQKKKEIVKNGYKGLSITTRVNKGDIHRYEIFITPEEIFVFKLGGKDDFAREKEADKFFNGIKLNIPNKTNWQDFSSPDGSFTAQMPHAPLFYGDTSLVGIYFSSEPFTAIDFSNGNVYSINKSYLLANGSTLVSDSLLLEEAIFNYGESKYYDVLERTESGEGNNSTVDVRYRMDESYHMFTRFLKHNGYLYNLSVKYHTDSNDVDRFVRSIRFDAKPVVAFEPYTDTLMHFTVTTAPQKSDLEKLIRKMGNNKAKDKDYLTLRENKAFIESTKSDEVVTVTYIRYGKYTRFKDSAEYWSDIIDDYNGDSSHIVLSEKSYAKNGFDIYEIDYTDTGCSLAIKEVNMQRNAVLYVLRTTYNPKDGLSTFSKKFFETFTPKDTLIGSDIFSKNAELVIRDLSSSDSATRDEARESLRNAYVKEENFKGWTGLIDTLQPTNDKYFEFKSQLIEKLWDIKTPLCINYLKGIYEKAGDTNTFQLSALKTLLYMETAESYKAFKDLLLNETPLGNQYEINSLFWSIDDSLELAATLYPDMLKLFSLDEYKEKVVHVLANLVDSNKISPQVYKEYLPALVNDAKNEVKRQSASDVETEQENSYTSYSSYGNNSGTYLGNLATLLVNYYDDKNVKGIFDKLLQTKDNDLRTDVAIRLAKNKQPVADSVWVNIAKQHSSRVTLYRLLDKHKLMDKFPAKYKTQDSMALALVLNSVNVGYDKVDTTVMLQKQLIKYQGDTGYVFFFKYRYKDNETWRLAMVGLQPADTTKINASVKFFNVASAQKITDKVSVEKQMAVMLKEEMLSIAKGWDYDYADEYSDYESEYYDEVVEEDGEY